jgi:SagB-type dehydrogenase family enzyme
LTSDGQLCRRYRLRANVSLAASRDGRHELRYAGRPNADLGVLSGMDASILTALGNASFTLSTLQTNALIDGLIAGGWIEMDLCYGDRRLLTILPTGPQPPRRRMTFARPTLSRFALIRQVDGSTVLESPTSAAVIVFHDMAALRVALTPHEPSVDPPAEAAEHIIEELGTYGFLGEADSPEDLRTAQWDARDLYFHVRSREGRHDLPMGATFWAANRYPPLPLRRELRGIQRVALPKDGTDDVDKVTLGAVLEARRTIRRHDDTRPMTFAQLAEFLRRVAAVSSVDGEAHGSSRRIAPSGGGIHSLEIYLVVGNVSGLDCGLYWFDPFERVLTKLDTDLIHISRLLGRAAAAAGAVPPPQCLIITAARFGRVMWKYQGIGYSLILKEVGALFQTMYLVATAMGLAPCALGAGDIQVFADASGLDWLSEGSVGEFMLGTPDQSEQLCGPGLIQPTQHPGEQANRPFPV